MQNENIRRSENQQNTELNYPAHILADSQKEASFRKMPHSCPLPGTLSDPLVHNPQVVLQSHVRNKTRCVFTRLLPGLSENGIRNSGFQLHPAVLKLLKAFLLMHTGTASASKLACSETASGYGTFGGLSHFPGLNELLYRHHYLASCETIKLYTMSFKAY